ncbi:hypothetical protein P7H71_04985 [Lactococcus lactis]|jgi:hypothetical protein|uniref:Uncharacterized protein n=1 Tax=Lactococcus lactis TaxID=1358 RepID=A0AAP5UE47_9LACT|nr:hypothetical protein [Lactococcus lactis]KST90536.1 hypothetical protein LKF24_1987 [Lactococcus lactis subsp. lactis]MBU7533120.1 hypothetical protein [Lactococcus lactis]MDT2861951.1 hypothetical protein [Lactococcus lactis]MDT2869609.1 hypothetical protein [Lactococcus lactis]MDT2874863.1 hypothetical protein [Lactococcus lactis]
MIFSDPYVQEIICQILNKTPSPSLNIPIQKNMIGQIQEQRRVLEDIRSKNLLPYILKLSALENEIKSMNHSKYEEEIEKIFEQSKLH